ncbi:uncharacterized protein [Temnothorax longispinosus]|uniref:uncharacterized protein n=1 Tax=Temnothorax longispinosus TaxID=300112 RepID=UPI003A997477
MNASKYEKLVKEPNTQIKKCNNPDNQMYIQVTNNVRQIFDNLNQSIQQKQKPDSSLTSYTSPSSTSKCKTHKLVDSKQVSGPFHQFDKKTFLLDTYVCIVANNNRRCPKRLRELAKPKRQARSDQNDHAANFDLNYGHVTKTYRVEDKRNLKESKKK